MKVILSIKPEFAFKIFEETKKFEFRRSIFKNKNVKSIIVYASSPTKKVIGEFEIEEILTDNLANLWEETKSFSGITEEFYYKYFTNKQKGFAIKIKNTKKYLEPKCLKDDFKVLPPQSFVYWNEK